MTFVIRQIMPPGKSARADEATAAALAEAAVKGEVVMGPYLVSSDPNARGGRGHETWSNDREKAKKFKTREEALACWNAQSTRVPFRPDGRPNKPMTAYSVSVEELTDVIMW